MSKKIICCYIMIALTLFTGCNKQQEMNNVEENEQEVQVEFKSEQKGESKVSVVEETKSINQSRPSNTTEYTQWAQEKLVENYWSQSTQSYMNTYPYNEEKEAGLNYWWKAHLADAMIDGYERTKDQAYADRAESIIKNTISRNGSLYNEFYDDMEWMALACLRLYDATGNEKMKEYSIKLWNDIKTGWWDDEIGGMAWKKDEHRKSRNACSNGPAAILAARLYQRFGDEEDLQWAKKIFEYEKKYLVDEQTGLVYDGLVVEEYGSLNINKDWLFTYNAGTYIGAAVELYRITNDASYLQEAERTAQSSMTFFTTPYGVVKSEGQGDGGLFKGIMIRYMGQLYEVNQDQAIADFIIKNAEVMTKNGNAPDKGIFGPEWNKIPQGSVDITCQTSAIFLLEAANKIISK